MGPYLAQCRLSLVTKLHLDSFNRLATIYQHHRQTDRQDRCFYNIGPFTNGRPKAAEPIDLPSGLWTRVGRRKQKFSRIRQVAPTYEGTLVPSGEYD